VPWTVNIAGPPGDPLPHSFYERPARVVARALLGKLLVHGNRSGRIVETEAYVGEHDLACHASRGRTSRTSILWGPPGRAYVYFVYGMHWCFNAVTGLEPVDGFEGPVRLDGPARLCRALEITGAQNGADLATSPLRILDAPAVRPRDVERGPRIGVDYAGQWAGAPLRFWVRGSRGVSRGPSARRGQAGSVR